MPNFTASALRADVNRFTPLTPQQKAGLNRIIGSGGGGGGGGAPGPSVYAGPIYAAGPSDVGGAEAGGIPKVALVAGGVAVLAVLALVVRKVMRKKRR